MGCVKWKFLQLQTLVKEKLKQMGLIKIEANVLIKSFKQMCPES
jgi:hypothetical protein